MSSRNSLSIFWAFRRLSSALTLTIVGPLLLAGCEAATTPMPVASYNHTTNTYVSWLSVNGAAGPNSYPGTGGGGDACCVVLPRVWKPGMRVVVAWGYTIGLKDADEKRQTVEIEVPKYAKPGTVNVHFYEGHRVKVIVSNCSLQHIDYPVAPAERAPFPVTYGDAGPDAGSPRTTVNECL